jgi:glycosyltransferase involved in cell wall biosynthesis
MQQVLFWIALATAAAWLLAVVDLALGVPRLARLAREEPLDDAEMPSLSIVVAARNEAATLVPALRSLLALDVPRLQVIVVNDRSDDATGELAEQAAAADPRLTVLHVHTLPAGWLGKNHALHLGAAQATGELLLFTDADVVLRPDTLRRAAGRLRRSGVDHLTAGPHVDMPGVLLQAFGVVFGLCFVFFVRPWRVSDPRSRHHVGIGAFNLLRSEAYRRLGGHEAIRMRPDDDLKLGKLVKAHGLRQGFVAAPEFVRVEWYHSVRGAVRGLRKNAFAGTDYRVWAVLLASVGHLLLFFWPFVALLLATGAARTVNALVVAVILLIFAGGAREQRVPVWYGVAVPLTSLLFVAVMWNSMLYTLWHRGIEWRGTHYPLAELKANRV